MLTNATQTAPGQIILFQPTNSAVVYIAVNQPLCGLYVYRKRAKPNLTVSKVQITTTVTTTVPPATTV